MDIFNNLAVTANFINEQTTQLTCLEKSDSCSVFGDKKSGLSVKLSVETEDGISALRVDTLSASNIAFDQMKALEISVGGVLPDSFFANHLVGSYWCRRFVGNNISECPENTQALLVKKGEGYSYFAATCDDVYKSAISGIENGIKITVLSLFDKLNDCNGYIMFFGTGIDPYKLNKECTEYGIKKLGYGAVNKDKREYPEVFEYLGWCSWDAFQVHVSEAGIYEKLQEFKDKNIPVRWALLDDMWGDAPGLNDVPMDADFKSMLAVMKQTSLNSFEADPVRFPNGLKHCIDGIKSKFGMKVGVWHPTNGYWYGIKRDSELAKTYKDCLIESAIGTLIHGVKYDKAFPFYDGFHKFLKSCGADFIKVDNQGYIQRNYTGVAPVGKVARNMQKAIDDSAFLNFDGALINCMCMPTECYWNRPKSAVARCSGDFMPESHEWFIMHLLQCAYNSYVQGALLYEDWDMWWTDDGQATKNGLLHAISGGPVYVSDKLGRSKAGVIEPIVFKDGRILRCDLPAVPTEDCLTVECKTSRKPLKLWTMANGAGIICAMNLDEEEKTVSGVVTPCDVNGFEADKCVIYEYFTKTATVGKKDTQIPVTLKNQDDLRLYIIVPIKDTVTPIGLTEKFVSPKSVVSKCDNGFSLYEGGICKFHSFDTVKAVTVNGENVSFDRDDDVYTFDCSKFTKPEIKVVF